MTDTLADVQQLRPGRPPRGRDAALRPRDAIPGQEKPLHDEAVEARMVELMATLMRDNDAPPEAFARLGVRSHNRRICRLRRKLFVARRRPLTLDSKLDGDPTGHDASTLPNPDEASASTHCRAAWVHRPRRDGGADGRQPGLRRRRSRSSMTCARRQWTGSPAQGGGSESRAHRPRSLPPHRSCSPACPTRTRSVPSISARTGSLSGPRPG